MTNANEVSPSDAINTDPEEWESNTMTMTQRDREIIHNGVYSLMQRKFDAETKFISDIVETFGFTQEEAEKIFRVYQKAKAVKTDVQMQRVNVTHGAFWEKEPMIRALGLYSELFH